MAAGDAYSLRNYGGGAADTSLVSDIGSSDTSFNITSGTGYPTTNFSLFLDFTDPTKFEKVWVGTRSGGALSNVVRGADGSSQRAHSAGAAVRHGGMAQDFTEANAVAAALTTKGDSLWKGATSTVAPARLAVGTDGQRLAADSTQTLGAKWVSDTQNSVVDAAGDMLIGTADNVVAKLATTGLTAWTSYTPTLTQSGTVTKTVTYAKYCQIGKTTLFNVLLTCTGSGTANNPVLIGTPVTAASASIGPIGSGVIQTAGSLVPGIAYLASTTTIQLIDASQANAIGVVLGQTGSIFVSALASGMLVTVCGHFEAA